jgi:hypothetical protein
MFRGDIVWRGVVYAILMAFGKIVTGLWLVRFPLAPIFSFLKNFKSLLVALPLCITPRRPHRKKKQDENQNDDSQTQQQVSPNRVQVNPHTMKPKSLYPPALLGLSMVARGEIGYLIASLAETSGIFSSSSTSKGANVGRNSSETYLVTFWAITICTLLGPIAVGSLVRRVKRLQRDRVDSNRGSTAEDPLGVWGIPNDE